MKELEKNFNFHEAEGRIYDWWETSGFFKPEVAGEDAEPYVISMPPPNVTGALHAGHAMFVSLEDLMIRHARMKGKAALWVPGSDHAGIATQLQVEKALRDEGTSREAVGREEFLRRTWAWKEKYGGEIQNQVRRLGASCDWTRERFTLDNGLSKAVIEAFVTLYEQGLIYKGTRLINWSPGLKTAVSDLEVENEEIQGKLYYFKYPVEGSEFIPVATTRPETILGDTAVAVHPDDERYQHLIGKTAYVPMLERPIPVIADEYVEREFGTGALKVTPGHDFNDYELGKKHALQVISVLNRDATMNANAGPYEGLDRFECRNKLWQDMEAKGLTLKIEDRMMVVPVTQRGGEIVEPMISEQWFVRMQPLAERGLEAVRSGAIQIVPERFTKVYYHWLENIQDWCISRQLWWGHRIPAWYHTGTGEIKVLREGPPDDSGRWVQDEDVLDTWFSSGLWPFSTLGWPEQTPDLKRFYPTSVMETGHDILFFWVARMIMMGMWFTEEVPFHTVYLHGLVMDEKGEKMSKTKGNVIDPLEMVAEYGADALRFALLTAGSPGNDQNLSVTKIEYGRNFGNKLWQMARFIQSNLPGDVLVGKPETAGLDLPSRWILSRLSGLVDSVNRLYEGYQFGEAGRQMLDFAWEEFAPFYIEISKHILYGDDETAKSSSRQVLVFALDTLLRLLHPYMPFITEEIWQHMPHEGESISLAKWPENLDLHDAEAEDRMGLLLDLVLQIRQARNEYNVAPGKRLTAIVAAGSYRETLEKYGYVFTRLCNIEALDFDRPAPSKAATLVAADVTLSLPLEELVDIEAERERLQKELDNLLRQIQTSQNKLANDGFVNGAPEVVVQRERDKLTDLQASLGIVEERLRVLS
ncbi:MAG: valine--tRNA ligase [Anaerolineae bacterium]|nr:MAG: valine--tRNA ligase [Anaerolineae bacterium]